MEAFSSHPFRTMFLFVTGGLIIEGVNYVRKEHRYKSVLTFVSDYPGFTLAGTGAVVALSMFAGRPLLDTLSSSPN